LHELAERMPNLCQQIKVFVGLIPKRKTTKKCREPHWNKVSREEEQYGEVEEEKKIEEGEFYCVLPERLAERETEVYRLALDYLQDKRNIWVPRSELVNYMVSLGKPENAVRGHMTNFCIVTNKNIKTNNEAKTGILFKKIRDRWLVRLN